MEVRLMVAPAAYEDAADASEWLAALGEELAELGEVMVDHAAGVIPEGAKGAGELVGLLARFPAAGITAVLQFLQAWVMRTGRTVEVSIDGDAIKVTGVSQEQQDRIIDAWLDRHSSRT